MKFIYIYIILMDMTKVHEEILFVDMIYCMVHIEGFRPEWCISTIYYA